MTLHHPTEQHSSNAQKLRALLQSPRVEHILEAHNALSASIVEEAGIPGIWASSLTLSAAAGMRDNSELTMTEVVDTLETMTAKVDIPILFDGDTGYGQFSHFQQLVRKLCMRSVGGVCIEDKRFPKTNSFLRSETQDLAPVDEFCGKIRAGKDAQTDSDFVVAARTEALIVGMDLEAALLRAGRYADAGADAVLVHSKDRTFAPVREFMRHWDRDVPVIVVPTTYYSTPIEAFQSEGISLVIWANQLLRAAIGAMQHVADEIGRTGSARDLEDEIVSVQEVFRLQDADGLLEGERQYLNRGSGISAVILAASRGSGMDELTQDRPKCMIPIGGTPVLEKAIHSLRAEGIKEISVVRGYKPEAVDPAGCHFFENPDWEETGEIASLERAKPAIKGDMVLLYGDVVFKRWILHQLLTSKAPITLIVDGTRSFLETGRRTDRVRCSAPAPERYDESEFRLLEMGPDIPADATHGEWIGMMRAQGPGTDLLLAALDTVAARSGAERMDLCPVFTQIATDHPDAVRVIYVGGDWVDINEMADVVRGNR